ncbi:MAG: pitrilysin family protein [Acidobacteriota bacterium]
MKEDINITRLPGGPTVLTDRMPGIRSSTVGFFFRVGSRHEPDGLNGISHFIEHTVFKGTTRRSALDIAIETDRLGGNLDAFTTHEETGFAIKVIDDQMSTAFDLIADMLVDPRFDDADLKSEQRVIIEEMKMVEDSPEDFLGEIFSEAFFPGHPLGMNIAGTPRTVRSFDSAKTRRYHAETYHAGNLVIAAAGNVRHEQVVELATQYFSKDQTPGRDPRAAISKPVYAAPIIIRQNKNLEQAHLIIAMPLISAKDERRYAADLLANILGGGTSSRLWQKVREERGLAYSVGAAVSMHHDCGLFSIFAGTSPDQVEEVVDLSIAEIRDIVKHGVTAPELTLAKQQTAASILLGLEDSAGRAATLAQQEMLHGRQITVEESLEGFNAVTLDDIRELAAEHFRTETMAFAALGDLKGLKIDRERLSV